ncbi:glycosyltransferase involved in cell wall biosynthesis [Flavobacterium arsenatis]|uniref:Glycosyltransferase involved in cell wall biosynthesis n=1 Tax=Flavobacterium arsenatis TaxID=1484332 RepID=A0ABU1TPK3_9FLAO|nr:glycosyltransferase [Flavobacterium arsenatis]MDR6967859.1 glycosyltransferase involved in cell wall biosynthesis [Flavobacterium arsenatis]
MKVLIVCSGNSQNICFITDQAESLKKIGVEISFYLIKGSGIKGYLKNYSLMLQAIKEFKPDLIHAHYGLSGLLSVLQRKIPVVTTYHGSDINDKKAFLLSKISIFLSKKNIFVSQKLKEKAGNIKGEVIPCGIDVSLFKPMDKEESRKLMKLELSKTYILFSSSFDNKVKNYDLARKAVESIENKNVELIELNGYGRNEVALLFNAVDVAIMTSFNEGSPQFIKEAMACKTPLVSTDVGDVSDLIHNVSGCYLTSYNDIEVGRDLTKALNFAKSESKTKGRLKILEKGLDEVSIANKILELYKEMLHHK